MGRRKRQNGNGGGVKKGQFGLSHEDLSCLRGVMKEAVVVHGEETVLARLGYESLDAVKADISIDMRRTDFGSIRNALKSLAPKKVKTNKYRPDSGNDSGMC